MRVLLQRFYILLRSRRLFWAILAVFICESAWIALSAVYPQAFDENFHFGLIKVYSHHWLPFLSGQPSNANAYGAVAYDPSYLYHYVMSFPYRIIALFAHSQMIQVIYLRFINIALAAAGLVLFYRVLLRARVSRAFANLAMALFILIPIVPQLAGQVNYDNMLFPLVAWAFLLAMKAADELRARKPSVRTLGTFVILSIFAVMVKYEFLPIAAGVVLFLLYTAHRSFRSHWRQFGRSLRSSWTTQSRLAKVVLVVLFVIGLGLFIRRDGRNLIEYHTFTPNCSKILSVQDCKAYGPWAASYRWHKEVVAERAAGPIDYENPVTYTMSWMYWLWYRLFFAVSGPVHDFRNYPPLPVPAAAGAFIWITGIAGVIVVAVRRRLFDAYPYIPLFGTVIAVYLIALWTEGYLQYHKTDVMVLMNGRYLLPILFPISVIVGRAFSVILRRRPALRSLAALVLLFCFIAGGGTINFIMRSDHTWDWPNPTVTSVNDTARKVLRPIIVHNDKYRPEHHIWFFN